MQIYVPNNLSRDQILGSLINDATFVFGNIINQNQVVLKFSHFVFEYILQISGITPL